MPAVDTDQSDLTNIEPTISILDRPRTEDILQTCSSGQKQRIVGKLVSLPSGIGILRSNRPTALNRHKNIDSDFSAANRKEEMMVLVELRRAIQRTNSMIIGRQSSIVHVLRCIKRTRLQYQEASKDFLTQAERLELVKGLIACEKLLPMEEDALKYIKNLNDMTIIRLTWDIDLMTLCKELCIHKETGGGDQERAGRSLDNLLALQSVDKMHHHEIRFMLTTLKENMAVIGRAEEFIWPVKQYCHKMDVAMGVHVPIGGLLGRHVIGTPSTDDAAATAGGRESKL